jgi:hypothetical protein
VSKWRRRFAVDRLEGLVDAPRPGAARTIADATIEAVVVDTLESTPGEDLMEVALQGSRSTRG